MAKSGAEVLMELSQRNKALEDKVEQLSAKVTDLNDVLFVVLTSLGQLTDSEQDQSVLLSMQAELNPDGFRNLYGIDPVTGEPVTQ